MADIVKRLRDWYHERSDESPYIVIREAADEIERLTAWVTDLEAANEKAKARAEQAEARVAEMETERGYMAATITKLRDRIAALEAGR